MPLIKPYDTFTDVKEHIKRGHILSAGATITIPATKIITVTDSFHKLTVGTVSATGAEDEVERINATVTAPAGQMLVLQKTGATTVKIMSGVGSGNINIKGDVTLNDTNDTLTLMYSGTEWVALSSWSAVVPAAD